MHFEHKSVEGYAYGLDEALCELERICNTCGSHWIRSYRMYIGFAEDDTETIEIYQGCPGMHENDIRVIGYPNNYGTNVEEIERNLVKEGYLLLK